MGAAAWLTSSIVGQTDTQMAAPGSGVPRPRSPARTDLPTCIPGVQSPGGAGPRVLPGQARPAMDKQPLQRGGSEHPEGRSTRPSRPSCRTPGSDHRAGAGQAVAELLRNKRRWGQRRKPNFPPRQISYQS